MKPLSGIPILIALVALVLFFAAWCSSTPAVTIVAETRFVRVYYGPVENSSNYITLIRDTRTNACFAIWGAAFIQVDKIVCNQ